MKTARQNALGATIARPVDPQHPPRAGPLSAAEIERALRAFVAECHADPLKFVLGAYPWRKAGTPLEHADGPDRWQVDALRAIGEMVAERGFDGTAPVNPIRVAISSGHGIGKSTFAAWIVNWLMATRPLAHGTVTANTFTQLETKTWAAVQTWTKLCRVGHWFIVNSKMMYQPSHKADWFCALQSSEKENSEAFAGQHAKTSSSFYLFDEASGIPDIIYEVAEGGMTDGEAFIFLMGNCTQSSGRFYQACFGSARNRWNPVVVDSRTSSLTNKAQIAEWIEDYGLDSDFVRVRVLGLPPRASDLQFIDTERVAAAKTRAAVALADDPIICGLDLARGGGDRCVFRFRRGLDARSIKPIVIPGEQARDSMRVVARAVEVLTSEIVPGRKLDMLFVDATGGSIGGPIADRLRQMGFENVLDVQFGGASPNPKYANMRAYMWALLRDWLAKGAIDPDPRLETDLTGPGYKHDKQDRVLLESKEEMKKRDVDSPDDGDALALTFAMPVLPKKTTVISIPSASYGPQGWMA